MAATTTDALQNHYTRQGTYQVNRGVTARVLDANALAAAQAAAAAQNAQAAARNKPVVDDDDTPTGGGNGGGGGGGKKKSSSGNTVVYYGGGGGYSEPSNPYADALALIKQNYNNSVKSVNSKYDAQVGEVKNEAADQLRQAYINYMMNRRNASNDMARQGYSGGLTESNLARLYNNYGTIRNDINKRTDEAVNKYNLSRNAELLNLLNNYNNQQLRYMY